MAEKTSLVDEFQSLLKIDETEKPSSVEEKERANPEKEFLIKLDQKVSAKLKIALLQLMWAKNYYVFLSKLTY